MLLTIAVIVINKVFFANGSKALVRLSPNMGSLVALESSAAFIYSIYNVFLITVVETNALRLNFKKIYGKKEITIKKCLQTWKKRLKLKV